MIVPRKCLIGLLKKHNCEALGKSKGIELWMTPAPHNLLIRLPETGAIPLALAEIICLEIFNMGIWEFDYFLGESGVQV